LDRVLEATLPWQGTVTCMALDRSGATLLAASRRWIGVWNLGPDGAPKKARLLDLVTTPFTDLSCVAAAIEPKESWAALGSADGSLFRLDLPNLGLERLPVVPRRGSVNDLRFDAEGRHLFVASFDSASGLSRFDVVGWGAKPLEGPRLPPRRLALSSDGQLLASGHEDGTVAIWSGSEGRLLASGKIGSDPITALSFLPDSRRLLAADEEGMLTALEWNGDLRQAPPFRIHRTVVTGLESLGDESRIATSSPEAPVRLWDLDGSPPLEQVLATDTSTGLFLAFPSARRVVAASRSEVWEWPTNEPSAGRRVFSGAIDEEIAGISPDGRWIVLAPPFGSDDRSLKLQPLAESPSIQPPVRLADFEALHARVAFSSKNRWLAAANFGKPFGVWLWQVGTGSKPYKVLREVHTAATDLAFSDDESFLASTDLQGEVHVWEVKTGREVWRRATKESDIGEVTLSPQGDQVAFGSLSGRIDVIRWGQPAIGIRSLDQQRGPTSSLAFDPSGRWLLSGSNDQTLLIWDVATGQVVGTIKDPDDSFVHAMAFPPEGGQVATLSQGGKRIDRWFLDPKEWARRALSIAEGLPP
jgi:WD40 repeat protein